MVYYAKKLMTLWMMLCLTSCSPNHPPVTTWIEVPVYPNSQLLQHDKAKEEFWVFTTTAPVTEVLHWYDGQYAHGWYDPRSDGVRQEEPLNREYEQVYDQCSRFSVYMEYEPITKVYTQTLSRFIFRDCR